MRSFLLGLFLGFFVVSMLSAMPQSSKPRDTMWLGTDLTLGMSEEAVVKRLAESYSLRKEEPPKELRAKGVTSLWVVDERKGDKHPSVGIISFAAGKLDSVTKFLLPSDADEVEFGRQLYFAMRELELEGNSRCTISTSNAEVPDFSHKTAKLQCGKKSMLIDLQRFQKYAESVQLNEELNAR